MYVSFINECVNYCEKKTNYIVSFSPIFSEDITSSTVDNCTLNYEYRFVNIPGIDYYFYNPNSNIISLNYQKIDEKMDSGGAILYLSKNKCYCDDISEPEYKITVTSLYSDDILTTPLYEITTNV